MSVNLPLATYSRVGRGALELLGLWFNQAGTTEKEDDKPTKEDVFGEDDGDHEILAGYGEKCAHEGAGYTSSFRKTCTSHLTLLRLECLSVSWVYQKK